MANTAWQEHLEKLPHGPEFRFVDALEHLEPGKAATARYTLQGTENFLQGHFPGFPLMPGVLMIEAIAQLAGVVAQSDPESPPLKNVRLTAVRGAKIMGSFHPGSTVELRVTLQGRMGGLVQAEGTVCLGASELLRTQVTLSGEI
jgi:3-hydroxyacyl-[acyl-carrier-protein] dehydratase